MKLRKINDLKYAFDFEEFEVDVFLPDDTSLHGINEITRDYQIYDLNFIDEIEIKEFLDVGANIGLSTIWAKYHFRNCKTIAIEPGKELANFYKKNTVNFKSKKTKLINAAASNSNSEIDFWFSDTHNGGSTTTRNMVSQKHSTSYKVESIDIFKFIKKNYSRSKQKNRLIKIDIEGGEDILISDERFLKIKEYFNWIMIELHGDVEKQLDQYEKLKEIFGEKNIAIEIQVDNHLNFRKTFGMKCEIEKYKNELFSKNIISRGENEKN